MNEIVIQKMCKKSFEPVVKRIDQLLKEKDEYILVAIDGKCAAGKTTLAYYLKELYKCKYVIIRICQQLYFSDTLFS